MANFTIGGKVLKASPITFEVMGKLMDNGHWQRIINFANLSEREAFETIVVVISLCSGVETEWIMKNGLPLEYVGLGPSFNELLKESGFFSETKSPNGESR